MVWSTSGFYQDEGEVGSGSGFSLKEKGTMKVLSGGSFAVSSNVRATTSTKTGHSVESCVDVYISRGYSICWRSPQFYMNLNMV